MVVGIDVHKRAQVAALLDERGDELDTLSFANSPAGMGKLCAWLVGHNAVDGVGVESDSMGLLDKPDQSPAARQDPR